MDALELYLVELSANRLAGAGGLSVECAASEAAGIENREPGVHTLEDAEHERHADNDEHHPAVI